MLKNTTALTLFSIALLITPQFVFAGPICTGWLECLPLTIMFAPILYFPFISVTLLILLAIIPFFKRLKRPKNSTPLKSRSFSTFYIILFVLSIISWWNVLAPRFAARETLSRDTDLIKQDVTFDAYTPNYTIPGMKIGSVFFTPKDSLYKHERPYEPCLIFSYRDGQFNEGYLEGYSVTIYDAKSIRNRSLNGSFPRTCSYPLLASEVVKRYVKVGATIEGQAISHFDAWNRKLYIPNIPYVKNSYYVEKDSVIILLTTREDLSLQEVTKVFDSMEKIPLNKVRILQRSEFIYDDIANAIFLFLGM